VRFVAAAPIVRLEMPVDAAGVQGYRAVVLRSDGVAVWRTQGLAPESGDPVVLEITAELLGADDYHVWFKSETVSLWLSMRILRHC